MRIQKFEDVIAWQRAQLLTLDIYKIFEVSKDYSFRDQTQRASISIMNNIAEGFDRGTDKELRYFLLVARGSTAEVRSMLYIAEARGYITVTQHKELQGYTTEISKLLSGFIKKLSTEDKRLGTV